MAKKKTNETEEKPVEEKKVLGKMLKFGVKKDGN